MTRLVIAAALATAIAVPAFAQSTEFYVVQDTTTKKCTIVDKKPTTTTVTQVAAGFRICAFRADDVTCVCRAGHTR